MKSWITSRNGAVTLSVFALLTFLGRGFMDWRYEYPQQDPSGTFDIPGALVYMALTGIWVWAILAATQGSRRGVIGLLLFALLLDVALAMATYFVFCPPWTGCEGWPNAWLWNWANLITGLFAAAAATLQLRRDQFTT
jgi:hypothetical protein